MFNEARLYFYIGFRQERFFQLNLYQRSFNKNPPVNKTPPLDKEVFENLRKRLIKTPPWIRGWSESSNYNFFTLYHNVTGKCRLSGCIFLFHQDFFLNISPHTFLSIFFIISIVPFENIVTCYYMIGDFTKTLKGKFTFSKSPPQAPLGYENLRERLIKPPP